MTSLLLMLLLLLSLVPAASAEGEERVRIGSAEEFLRFAAACAEESYSAGRVFELTADLDLSNTAFEPVPYFAGRFLGNHRLITGLSVTGDGSRLGLFRRVAPGAEIRELTVRGTVSPGGTAVSVGGIAGENAGSIIACGFDGSVSGIENVGGITGTNTAAGLVESCSFSGALTAEHQAGGIAGRNDGHIKACTNHGAINTVAVTARGELRFDLSAVHEDDFVNIANLGGIAGENNGSVLACVNRGPVGYKHDGFNVGGIVGKSAGYVYDCANSAPVTGRRDVGGIVGQLIPFAAWDLSNGRLEELAGRLGGMQNLLNDLRRDVKSFSEDIAWELSLLNDYTHQALDAVEELMGKTVENELTIEASFTYDGEQPVFDFSASDLWSLDVEALNEALNNMRGEAQYIAALAGDGLHTAANDLGAVAKQMDAVFSTLLNTVNAAGSYGATYDLSESQAYQRDTGAVDACRNTGAVDAESNAGGVTGTVAFELDFDMEDRLHASDFLVSDARRYLFAAVRGCSSYGAVTVKNEGAGCVAGTADIGVVINCIGVGEARAQSGDCVGGIVGSSGGSVIGCWSRAVLSGRKYVGGIAGLGTDLKGCRSWTHIDEAREYRGAVAGWTTGTVADNLYVPDAPDGVDGVSLLGQTARSSAEALLALPEAPGDFDRITLRFVLPGGGTKTVEVPFGGSIESLPSVPNRSGAFWRWDEFDRNHIYYSTTVEGRYYAPGSTLSTGEEVPRFLVEGVFYEGQQLTAADYTAPLPPEEVLRSATLYVSGYEGDLTVRMQAPEDGVLYRANADGTLEKLGFERDGSYLVFPLENGGSIVWARKTEQSRPPWLIPAAAGGAALIALAALRHARKKKGKAKKDDTHAP